MVPEAKYHSGDAVLWHGAWDQPSGLKTDWVTATPPPAVTTLSASHVPEESVGIAGATAPSAGTATSVCPVAPVSVTAVTAAVTARAVVLVSTSEPGATPPAVDWPVQYQADDSASGAPTSALGVGAAATGAGEPCRPTATAIPATTSTTRATTRHRRSRLTWAGVTTAPSRRGPPYRRLRRAPTEGTTLACVVSAR